MLNLPQQFPDLIQVLGRLFFRRLFLDGSFQERGGGDEIVEVFGVQFGVVFAAPFRIQRAQLVGHVAICRFVAESLATHGQLLNVPCQRVVGGESAKAHEVETFQQVTDPQRLVLAVGMEFLKRLIHRERTGDVIVGGRRLKGNGQECIWSPKGWIGPQPGGGILVALYARAQEREAALREDVVQCVFGSRVGRLVEDGLVRLGGELLRNRGMRYRRQVLLPSASHKRLRIPLLEVGGCFVGEPGAAVDVPAVAVVVFRQELSQAAVPDGIGRRVFRRGGELLVEDAAGGVRAVVVLLAELLDFLPFLGDFGRTLRLSGGDQGGDDHGGGD